MRYLVSAILVAAGVFNCLPIAGVVGAMALHRLYGVSITDPDLLILMRHRAVLFLLIGGTLIIAAFIPAWRVPAIAVNLAAMLSFVALAVFSETNDQKIVKVMVADVATSIVLILTLILHLWIARSQA